MNDMTFYITKPKLNALNTRQFSELQLATYEKDRQIKMRLDYSISLNHAPIFKNSICRMHASVSIQVYLPNTSFSRCEISKSMLPLPYQECLRWDEAISLHRFESNAHQFASSTWFHAEQIHVRGVDTNGMHQRNASPHRTQFQSIAGLRNIVRSLPCVLRCL